MSEQKKRGAPSKWKRNPRMTPEELAAEPDDGFPSDMKYDGGGEDYRMRPPPWDETDLEAMQDNLDHLRVDPTNTISEAMDAPIVRAICGHLADYEVQSLGRWLEGLLEHDSEVIAKYGKGWAKMAENRDSSPHDHYWALKAYHDFVEEFGFDPSHSRLAGFMQENRERYPIGNKGSPGSKEWWALFFGAGLSRLGN